MWYANQIRGYNFERIWEDDWIARPLFVPVLQVQVLAAFSDGDESLVGFSLESIVVGRNMKFNT